MNNDNLVYTKWTIADFTEVRRTFDNLEDAILTFRKLRKARGSKKVISNLQYKIGVAPSDYISTR